MTQLIVAVFRAARWAEVSLADLEVARVPTMQVVKYPVTRAQLGEDRNLRAAPGDSVVAVKVDERHADLVRSILNMQASAIITEARTSWKAR